MTVLRKFGLSIGLTLCTALPSSAQNDSSETTPTANPMEEIIVRGQRTGRTDPGLSAFFAGDYATAEIEFQKSFTIKRRAFEGARTSAELGAQSQTRQQIIAGPPPASGGSGGVSIASPSATSNGVSTVDVRRSKTGPVRHQDLGFPLYMSGLSQLRLRKYDEARRSFERALRYNNEIYDIRLRLGLLAMRDGDLKVALKQLSKLKSAQKTCIRLDCEDRQDLDMFVTTLETALSKAKAL